jgi:aspartate/methionine/tyrosine aminotransferase
MRLPPFLLDEWISRKFSADPPIEYDLASSTGPVWTFGELLALEPGADERLLETPISYTNPRGSVELREEIARMYGADPDHVQVFTGGSEALLAMFFHAAEPGANVVLPYPEFPAYTALGESFRVEIRRYRLRAEAQFRIDIDEIRRLIDGNTRFVMMNSPHNPTGAVVDWEGMQALHDLCAARGVMFVSDEVYHPIYHGEGQPSAARLPHATVLSDFSKALCLSGLRTGWILEPDAARREVFRTAHNYFTVSNTAVGDPLAALAIRHREAIYDRARRITTANLSILDEFFARHADRLRWVRPAGGMTAFPWLAERGDARVFCEGLMRSGVLVVPGDCFGMPEHFRIGFAAAGEKFAAAIDRLDAAMGTAIRRGAGV